MSIPTPSLKYKRGLRRHLLTFGITFTNIDGVITFSDETLALQLITAYNPLATVRAEARERIKLAASAEIYKVYPIINPTKPEEAIALYNLITDGYLHIKNVSRKPLEGRYLEIKEIHDIVLAKMAEVNAMTNPDLIEAYDAAVGW